MTYDEIAAQLQFFRDIGVTELDVPTWTPVRAASGEGLRTPGSESRDAAAPARAAKSRPETSAVPAPETGKPRGSGQDALREIMEKSLPMQPRQPPASLSNAPSTSPSDPRPDVASRLDAVRQELGDCQRCGLAGGRTNIVFGAGNPAARLVLVGEAPGADEDRQGVPFVGRAGQLLTKIIESIGMSRDDVYICNVLKCRPPGNRNPEPVEVEACSPFLRKQLGTIGPKIVCCMGTFAAQTVLGMKIPISQLRGKFHEIDGILYMATFHPAYLLRNPEKKREVWEDMKKIRAELMGA
jgi:DNA polymerase